MVAALHGIRVIDWTHVLAGPACAYYLGQLGAEVIKVERPGRGDAMRHRGGSDPVRASQGMSTAFLTQSAGKKTLAVDLETPRGREVFERLLRSADVLVENHRPATLERLSLTERHTRDINPRLIHCAMTGYGRDNAMSDSPAYDVNIQAISGLMALTGTPETGPIRTGAPIIDYATGLAGALGVMSALMSRNHCGEGAFVDVSMLETAFALMSSTITDYRLTGTEPQARGNAANSRSPSSGIFPCKEGHLSLGVNEEGQFRSLAEAIGRSGWLSDPRFATPQERDKNKSALVSDLTAVLLAKTAHEWEVILLEAGVPCARLRSLPEALDLNPAKDRAFSTRGPAGFVGLPFKAETYAANSKPRPLGADTRSLLSELAFEAAEVDAMLADGTVEQAE
ncbi:crotonobetainyl-CoA:carnitine CoA-transferase CaiB-like acyl-CoA transferase [Litoreibacter ponti]|uniref:Crotonobetainyl-CoA:carnitine CoA-transferase CaiB-like acyl-CoA transferase n=1 Tax=Litoreibacter ponti TaxID=1510457 RepID=A0A2T6BHE8_9RHOB|nr:CoA transferase [Litoreibacter ponti]PTX55466.1 crotonobetainyl-CoA:carnitine CoA-transferase CaiB-like acyl-CoA transferase [Litoreibacter ponti]